MAKRLWGLTIVAAASIVAGRAAAQSNAAEDGSAGPEVIDLPPITLETVSVTATRNPIDAFEYPGMVSVINREEILRRQPSTADDILKWVPNVEFYGGPRRTGEVPSIRGFEGPEVIVTLDGARQNFEAGHDSGLFVDPSLLREVEVLRGSASSLYGSGGMGGVIALRTVRADDFLAPDETAGVRVGAGYQSVNREKHEVVTAYGKPTDGLDLVGSVTKRDSGSIELGGGGKLDRTDDDIISGLAKAGYQFADHHHIEGSFQRFDNDAEEPNNAQGAGGDNMVDKDIQSDNWRVSYSYDDPANQLVNLDVTTYYTSTSVDELRLDDNGSGPAGELLEREVDTIGFRLDNRSQLTLGNDVGVLFTYGAEAYRDEQEASADGADRDSVPDAETAFAGAFGQAEVRISEPFGTVPGDLLIIPGVRFDRFTSSSEDSEDNEDQAVSPRIGVSYLPTDWSLLFANYGAAFRAPTINELYPSGEHFRIPVGAGVTNRFVPNPNLKPQRTQTFEFGGGLDFDDVLQQGDRFRIKASHFRTEGEDFIDLSVNQPTMFVDCNPFIPGACDGTTTSENVADAKLWGNEVEATYENRRIRLAVGFSTLDGEDQDTGDPLGVLTPPQLTTDLAFKLPEVDSVLGWRMLAADEFDEVTEESDRRPGYAVHDLYYSWSPRGGVLDGLRVDLGIDNLFDKEYARVYTGANEPGRSYKGFVSYSMNF